MTGQALPRALAALGVAALAVAALAQPGPPSAPELRTAPVTLLDGEPYVRASDVARLLDAATFWHAETRKLELRAGEHRIRLTVDHPFVLVDRHVVRLDQPVISRSGALQLPVALVDSLPHDGTIPRLVPDLERRRVIRVPREGLVRSPVVSAGDSVVRLVVPTDRPDEAAVTSRAREHFRVRLPGVFAGRLPELDRDGLLRGLRLVSPGPITVLELTGAPGLRGFRLVPDGARHTVTIEFAASLAGREEFAAEGRFGDVRVIVLDPGHGGADRGVVVPGASEEHLALTLAHLLRADLERRLQVEVVMTRAGDHGVPAERRAEIANSARADLVLSLHFDGAAGTTHRGITVWSPPAGLGSGRAPSARRLEPVAVVPWRDVALGHAVASRAVADAVLGSIEQQGLGPSRLREFLAAPMLGVNAPALVIECGVLTSAADRERLRDPLALRQLSAAIADGVMAWVTGR